MSVLSFAIFVLGFTCIAASEYCKLDTKACSCIATDGWGVDLRNISGTEITNSRYDTVDKSGFILSLCQDSQILPDYVNLTLDCNKGFSICQITAKHNTTNNEIIGYDSEVVVHHQNWSQVDKATDESSLVFAFATGTLRMVCVKDAMDMNLVVEQDKNGTKNMKLYTPAACLSLLRPPPPAAEGLGTGAVISIIILVTLFSYCTLGIVYNHFVRGTRGAELIPNLDFWRQLPSLVMDGIRFIQNGCRPATSNDMAGSSGRETYDSI